MANDPIYKKTLDDYYGSAPVQNNAISVAAAHAAPEPTLKEKIAKVLTPTVRKWAYGVTAAALTVGATFAGKPEFIPVVAPLLVAIWYVTPEGEPRDA